MCIEFVQDITAKAKKKPGIYWLLEGQSKVKGNKNVKELQYNHLWVQ